MMTSATLFRYISRTFLMNILMIMGVLLGIIFILDTIDLMRRAAHAQGVGFDIILSMGGLHMTYTILRLLPFGVLFGAIYSCWKLNRTQELVVIRSAGLSAWQFLTPMLAAALLVGVAAITVVNPISALMASKYKQMEIIHLNAADDLLTVSRTGIWLRQPTDGGYALLHADSFDQSDWRFNNVIAFFFKSGDSFQKRIDSPVTYLRDGNWEIRDALINEGTDAARKDVVLLPTSLTTYKIAESFADPEAVSFWKMPDYINIMEETGLPTASLEIHFQSLLALPFLLAAMVLLAATFSLRPPRFGGVAGMIALGVAAGFFIFFLQSMLAAFGTSLKIPVMLAAWAPVAICLLFGATALLHLEDG